ncbi:MULTISPECIES: sulfur carrier protein ThiS [Vibrio]|uniref:Thiamine biosynthesis protein ThiS n=1 Tax=Vibrio bivalvicida TaxID=1276888 RepID=A0A177Y3X1_9VIBR|nr:MULTISPECIES: sulfur carrier protein ThiS [Vibrio]KLN63402.1 thiamine biosynthesis protein ThiS [Vibrio sp. VPAP30]OAJ95562.1 thiamine biosynthesis protein ThiS [Vibrio bivalvicida]
MALSEQQTTQALAEELDVITIVINDQSHQVASASNLQQIIRQFELPEMGCVFAINNNVVPHSEWASTVLSQGDSISLFQAIAGG